MMFSSLRNGGKNSRSSLNLVAILLLIGTSMAAVGQVSYSDKYKRESSAVDEQMEVQCIDDYGSYCRNKKPGFMFSDGCRDCICGNKEVKCRKGECTYRTSVKTDAMKYCEEIITTNEEKFKAMLKLSSKTDKVGDHDSRGDHGLNDNSHHEGPHGPKHDAPGSFHGQKGNHGPHDGPKNAHGPYHGPKGDHGPHHGPKDKHEPHHGPKSDHGHNHGPHHGPKDNHGPNHGQKGEHGPKHGPKDNHGPNHGPKDNHGPHHGPKGDHGHNHGPHHGPKDNYGPHYGPKGDHGHNHGPHHGPKGNHGPKDNHGHHHGPKDNHGPHHGPKDNHEPHHGPKDNHRLHHGPKGDHEHKHGPHHGPKDNHGPRHGPKNDHGQYHGPKDHGPFHGPKGDHGQNYGPKGYHDAPKEIPSIIHDLLASHHPDLELKNSDDETKFSKSTKKDLTKTNKLNDIETKGSKKTLKTKDDNKSKGPMKSASMEHGPMEHENMGPGPMNFDHEGGPPGPFNPRRPIDTPHGISENHDMHPPHPMMEMNEKSENKDFGKDAKLLDSAKQSTTKDSSTKVSSVSHEVKKNSAGNKENVIGKVSSPHYLADTLPKKHGEKSFNEQMDISHLEGPQFKGPHKMPPPPPFNVDMERKKLDEIQMRNEGALRHGDLEGVSLSTNKDKTSINDTKSKAAIKEHNKKVEKLIKAASMYQDGPVKVDIRAHTPESLSRVFNDYKLKNSLRQEILAELEAENKHLLREVRSLQHKLRKCEMYRNRYRAVVGASHNSSGASVSRFQMPITMVIGLTAVFILSLRNSIF